jgi:hypothetical protein
MSDPVLRQLTASEPLTLDEEYSMQSEFATLHQSGKRTFKAILSTEKWQEDSDSDSSVLN